MRIILSVALSSDWKLDDASDNRLVISNAKDWQEVYDLRGECDAILVGANTLRKDNPSLRIKTEEAKAERQKRGLSAELCRITMTRSGELDPSLKFFSPTGKAVVFSEQSDNHLLEQCSQVVCGKPLTARSVAAKLEKMGIQTLMIEGGSQILKMFLSEGVFDELRVAQSPMVVGDDSAPELKEPWRLYPTRLTRHYSLDDMTIRWFERSGANGLADYNFMLRAIAQSELCEKVPTHYCVGAVIVTTKGEVFEGYTGETAPNDHAEEAAIKKADAVGANLQGATIYSSMEPCSTRSSKPKSCSEHIIERGFSRVVFALAEPTHFVKCEGVGMLRQAGIEVVQVAELACCVKQINSFLNI